MTNAIRAFDWLIPWFAILSFTVLVGMLIVHRFTKRPGKGTLGNLFGSWLLACWYMGVLMITIIPTHGGAPIVFEGEDSIRYALLPFDGWVDQYGLNQVAIRESVLNIVLFIPGAVLSLWFTRMSPRTVIMTILGFGIAIEVIQLATNWGRVLTTTDVIMYAVGALVGWGFYSLLGFAARQLKRSAAPNEKSTI